MRWLLIERAKYFHHFYDKTQKGWYIIKKGENNISDGKKFFLESVGFEIIELDDYESIYEKIWKWNEKKIQITHKQVSSNRLAINGINLQRDFFSLWCLKVA